jgi:hypothetical protein
MQRHSGQTRDMRKKEKKRMDSAYFLYFQASSLAKACSVAIYSISSLVGFEK